MRKGELKSLQDVSSSIRRKMPVADPAALIRSAFRLPDGSVTAVRRGDVLFLSAPEKTARCALRGMETQVLAFLASKGHLGLRRIVWSAE